MYRRKCERERECMCVCVRVCVCVCARDDDDEYDMQGTNRERGKEGGGVREDDEKK